MNKKKALSLLLTGLGNILHYPSFEMELLALIAGSGKEDKVVTLLKARLYALSVYGVGATVLKEFENLGDGLFSMHLTGSDFNIRILYAFLPNRQPVLLSCFYEREGKKNTDYTGPIREASARLEVMRKEYEHGPQK